MTKNELRDELTKLGIKYKANDTKDELIALLEKQPITHTLTSDDMTENPELEKEGDEVTLPSVEEVEAENKPADVENKGLEIADDAKVEVKEPETITNPDTLKEEYLFVIKDFDDRSEIYRKNGDFVRVYKSTDHNGKQRELARKFVETRTWRLRGFLN